MPAPQRRPSEVADTDGDGRLSPAEVRAYPSPTNGLGSTPREKQVIARSRQIRGGQGGQGGGQK
jgi:hypothetical protein